jgi:3-isopropylmalate dehydrogenase
MRIAVIPGDGIGPEVTAAALGVLRAAVDRFGVELSVEPWDLGAERYLRDGITISDEEFDRLTEESDAIFLGALGDPRVPSNVHARDILLGLRFKLDLFVNYRPCELLAAEHSPLKGDREIALHVFRENTEGVYVNPGSSFKQGTPQEIAIQEDLNTWFGVERIVRVAFVHARERGLKRVTLVDKANAMPASGKLWRRVFSEVGGDFPEVRRDAMYVDAMAMDLVRRPETYEVIVTSNLFGDIVSDLAAEITGGLGLAPSANVHPGKHALFEPVHGSAPDIAGRGVANPIGAVRSVALLLRHFKCDEAADAVEDSVREALRAGVSTPDLGGTSSTAEVGEWLADAVTGVEA